MATINDIAKKAGVSTATVSYVFSSKSARVAVETRNRILKIAEDLDYRPNWLARGLASKKTGNIGFIVSLELSKFISPCLSEVLMGAEEIVGIRKYNLLMLTTAGRKIESLRDLLRTNFLDGVLMVTEINDPVQKLVQEQNLPHVLALRQSAGACVSVDADNFAGAYEIVSHFIKVHRFTKIVYVAGVANFEGVGERFTAYNKALMDNGIEPDKALYVENTEMTEVAGALAFWKISKVLMPPYAVFAATDTLAYGYMKAAQKAGLRVPDDVAIAGFDDSVMAEYCEPGLTTARQPFRDIGRIAATELISMVDRKTASSGIIKLPTKLIIRGSCGCC